MAKLLIISFDAVGDTVFDKLRAYPHFAAFAAQCTTHRGADTVFLSNTYPVHTSVVTGVLPETHGLISNTDPFPSAHPVWWYHARRIKAKTLWQTAHEKGLTVATVLWPVTAGAKEIRYNLPELLIQPEQNQLVENLREGSKLLQLILWLRHRKLLDGTRQPALDRFAVACMKDILTRRRPDLALVHLTAYDTLCHHYGQTAAALEPALQSLDDGLGTLLAAAGEDASVILFSDHAQLDVRSAMLPNDVLIGMGLLRAAPGGGYRGGGIFIECCGGSAFLHPGPASPGIIAEIRRRLAGLPGFNRFLTAEEMRASGRPELPLGFCALPGYCIEALDEDYRGQHGYPLDYADYKVFYMARGQGIPEGASVAGGSLLDIAPLAISLLGC
jgi:hypothetical protein